VPKLNSPKYVYGMALWVAAELGFDIPTDTRKAMTSVVENRKHWKAFEPRTWTHSHWLRGAGAPGSWPMASTAHDLFEFLSERYSCPSGRSTMRPSARDAASPRSRPTLI